MQWKSLHMSTAHQENALLLHADELVANRASALLSLPCVPKYNEKATKPRHCRKMPMNRNINQYRRAKVIASETRHSGGACHGGI